MYVSSTAHHYAKGPSIVLCYTCSIQATMEHIPNCVVDFDYHTTKISNSTTLYLTAEENKISHLEDTMTLVRWKYTILMAEKVNSLNITVLWIHHLMALQEYEVVMQNLLHLHLNLSAWQVEHMLCLNGRQPGANIHIKI